MRKFGFLALLLATLPLVSQGQTVSEGIYNLNGVLDKLFKEMLPLCSRLIDIGRAIGGFAALWYISFRVWKHLAAAEPINFFPLLRPFAIGIAIGLFPQVVGMLNGVLHPTVEATRELSKDSQRAIIIGLEEREKAVTVTPPFSPYPSSGEDIDKYEQPDGSTSPDGNSGSSLRSAFSVFSIKGMIKAFIMEVVQILYSAAALCVNTIRTFYLLILAILGPLVFGLSIFDGFENSLTTWFSRYINIFMWLPVANLFGAISSRILVNMMELDQNFFSSVAYIVFMIISIIGYTTVPNVANYIVQAVAGESDTLLHKINSRSQAAARVVAKAAGSI